MRYEHVPSAYINILAEEGTREELIKHLQDLWNENQALKERVNDLMKKESIGVKW